MYSMIKYNATNCIRNLVQHIHTYSTGPSVCNESKKMYADYSDFFIFTDDMDLLPDT